VGNNFERIKLPIQTNKQIFIFMVGNRMIKQSIVKSKTNVLFNNAMLEGRRVTFNVKFALLFHKENILKQKPQVL